MPSSANIDDPLVPAPANPGRQGVVLLDLPAEKLPRHSAGLRRLGRRPPRFRWLPGADDEVGRVLARVEDPPLLVLWRLLETVPSALVYSEQVPGVWVQMGFRHKQPERLRPP